jgi:hypothetical protein
MHKVALFASTSLLLAAAAQASDSAPVRTIACFPYQDVARQLAGSYAEAPASLGIQSNGNLLQVFTSADTGSWTILSTTPDGLACVLAAGERWESLPAPKAGRAA